MLRPEQRLALHEEVVLMEGRATTWQEYPARPPPPGTIGEVGPIGEDEVSGAWMKVGRCESDEECCFCGREYCAVAELPGEAAAGVDWRGSSDWRGGRS